jgi:hypothetical protein
MEKKDRELAARERSRSLDQMKSKIQTLVEKMLRGMQQPELAKIAFSVQHWQDDFCSEGELKLAQTGKDELVSVIMEEADLMSLSNLQHLSQSLIALQRRKR